MVDSVVPFLRRRSAVSVFVISVLQNPIVTPVTPVKLQMDEANLSSNESWFVFSIKVGPRTMRTVNITPP